MNARMENNKKRSLILAGGGIKVAFQAGVMQVWLDEAGLEFDHVDAASGGVFNLAMMCNGNSGHEIANNWRNLNPREGISFNLSELVKLFYAESMFTLDNYRKNVFTAWKYDWEKIRSSDLNGTFNVFNFSKKQIEVIEPGDMTEDLLAACVSLPMWFPPVRINEETYIDAVFMTDANIEEAIRRGADEIWVIWTVSDRDEWNDGFLANYFQIIETSAVGHYRLILKRIRENNRLIESGENGEFGRHIEVKELKSDVGLHYLINFSQDRLTEAVNQGVKKARDWCTANGIEFEPIDGNFPTEVHEAHTILSFTEEMKGFMTLGETDYQKGYARGREEKNGVMFHLSMNINGVNRFVTRPGHDTDDIEGYVEAAAFGGKCAVKKGWFNLIVDQENITEKTMLYRLFFYDQKNGRELTLTGFKVIKDDPGFDLWEDTTTLYTQILAGHISADEEEALRADPAKLSERLVAAGIIHIYMLDFMKQLTT
ncbi:MAG: hypothetical protein HKN25_02410, partial [Pyrinomonadaceae bacterium]|nr:hypothetical protein [Pyrinomonadaceae bacterium]